MKRGAFRTVLEVLRECSQFARIVYVDVEHKSVGGTTCCRYIEYAKDGGRMVVRTTGNAKLTSEIYRKKKEIWIVYRFKIGWNS